MLMCGGVWGCVGVCVWVYQLGWRAAARRVGMAFKAFFKQEFNIPVAHGYSDSQS